MLPSVLTSQLQQGAEDFLRTTFSSTTPRFGGMIGRFLGRGESVFKGPYVSVDLPFRHSGHGPGYFPEVPLEFPPYAHQAKAFERLKGPDSQSTLIATGTGSGKTEAFLWPILDYVRQHKGEKGIKAILIYPMNALANDQASRIAEAVDKVEALSGVRAGLFVGDREESPTVDMGPDHVITSREAQRLSPPDILLTNYKMLDYLLTRPGDAKLWSHNGPETLQYLVVDELHTFDGAQGTDLACLVRRLRDRLGAREGLEDRGGPRDTGGPQEGHLCCVGTSATLGGAEDTEQLRSYAGDVFGQPFEEGSVIREDRRPASQFLKGPKEGPIPTSASARDLSPGGQGHGGNGAQEEYVRKQAGLWIEEEIGDLGTDEGRIRLGEALRQHPFLEALLEVAGEPRPEGDLARDLAEEVPRLRGLPQKRRRALLRSFLSLLAWARAPAQTGSEESDDGQDEDVQVGPLLQLRSQLWLRELKRMVASVEAEPELRYWDDLPDARKRKPHLPVARCLECSAMGWVAVHHQKEDQFEEDLKGIYRRFFGSEPTFSFGFPVQEDEEIAAEGRRKALCGHDLHLSEAGAETCESCGRGDRLVDVFQPDNRKTTQDDRQVGSTDCPFCGTPGGLTIVGSQASSLSSVLISQLFASSYNEDKSLLTFSDSVQDASHRAGYFGARTYRFNLRSAVQQAVERFEGATSLQDLEEKVADHYLKEMGEERFISTFIAPDMEWFSSFEALKEDGEVPEGSSLTEDVKRRLRWEVWSAYGFRSQTGRTLEKTGASVAVPSPEHLSAATRALMPRLQNEIGGLRDLSRGEVRQFIRGVARHLRAQGAIYHSELKSYVESGGNGYLLNRRNHLPGLGRLPTFITNRAQNSFEPAAGGGSSTWLEKWALKCFAGHGEMLEGSLSAIYDHTLKALVETGLLRETSTKKGGKVWGLKPSALQVREEVAQLQCKRCGHVLATWEGAGGDWGGAPCLQRTCRGRYERRSRGRNYYRRLYRQSDLRRVVAREHTGLLGRETRENLEEGFQRQERPWSPNLLSCTPTLELGVDVGKLSSVILCSVPPSSSNFAQRIGRGGRKSGNAIDVTVANGRPHDLYFFEDPPEMIAGDIDPPGVFLEAVEVLLRQFVAYCFDRWIQSGSREVPSKLSRLLNSFGDEDVFPGPWLEFTENRREDLLEDFVGLFGGGEKLSRALRAEIESESIRQRVRGKLKEVKARRKDLNRQSRRLYRNIQDLEEEPETETRNERIEDLRREKTALQKMYRQVGEQNTYNFLTSAGLLPNYAFPESGVTLRSVLYSKGEDEEGVEGVESEEYVRPAAQALTDLAPGAKFYANGRKVEVDQIDLSGEEAIERWRFCDRCSNMVPAAEEAASRATCPECGSPTWSDQGQERSLVRHSEVRATTSKRKSWVDDPSEERGRNFFVTGLQPQIEDSDVEKAYRIDDVDLPFGFELVEQATLREVNFGNPQDRGTLRAGGEEIGAQGFSTCKSCGRVATGGDPIEHTRSCRARQQELASETTETLFLYREVSSEVVRILLPETSFAGEPEKVQSFKAALELGLREHYEGSVSHLKTEVYEGPGDAEIARRKYLLLYDTVPGGTGYLADLLRDESVLLEVLREALGVLEECPCIDEEGRDGCYRCLYAYRNHYDMPYTSRAVAQRLLSKILERSGQIEEISTVSEISVQGALESELEARFLKRLENLDVEETRLRRPAVQGGTYDLQLGERRFEIEPQVTVGPSGGVPRPSRIDFVIRPEEEGRVPIAVFLDGFQYHRERIGKDLAQRRALRASGKCHVWSLTWKDVEEESSREQGTGFLKSPTETFVKVLQSLGASQAGSGREAVRKGSFEWLISFLKNPGLLKKIACAQALLFAQGQRAPRGQGASEEQGTSGGHGWKEAADAKLPEPLAGVIAQKGKRDEMIAGLSEMAGGLVHLWAAAPKTGNDLPEGVTLALHLSEEDSPPEETWNEFLRLYNLLQLIPETYPAFGKREGDYTDLIGQWEPPEQESFGEALEENPSEGKSSEAKSSEAKSSEGRSSGKAAQNGRAWEPVLKHALPETEELLKGLKEKGAPPPEVPQYALQREGQIVAQAELAWPEQKVAVHLPARAGETGDFVEEGWSVYPLGEAKESATELARTLRE